MGGMKLETSCFSTTTLVFSPVHLEHVQQLSFFINFCSDLSVDPFGDFLHKLHEQYIT